MLKRNRSPSIHSFMSGQSNQSVQVSQMASSPYCDNGAALKMESGSTVVYICGATTSATGFTPVNTTTESTTTTTTTTSSTSGDIESTSTDQGMAGRPWGWGGRRGFGFGPRVGFGISPFAAFAPLPLPIPLGVPAFSTFAPPAFAVAPPAFSTFAPPAFAVAPPAFAVAPPAFAVAPPAFAVAPPAFSVPAFGVRRWY
jgi:hypothetical protein